VGPKRGRRKQAGLPFWAGKKREREKERAGEMVFLGRGRKKKRKEGEWELGRAEILGRKRFFFARDSNKFNLNSNLKNSKFKLNHNIKTMQG